MKNASAEGPIACPVRNAITINATRECGLIGIGYVRSNGRMLPFVSYPEGYHRPRFTGRDARRRDNIREFFGESGVLI